DEEDRRTILRTLANVVFQDIDLGGYGFADEAYAAIMEQATPEEKAQIATWTAAELEGRDSPGEYDSGWSRRELGRFQLELLGDTIDDERFIELCQRSQLLSPLLERLLVLDRRQEAIEVARGASDYELLNLADIFVAHGLGTTAEELLWERTARSSDPRLEEWIKKYAASRKDWRRALRYATRQFSQSPSLHLYGEIREYAEEIGDWPEQREKLITDLAATGKNELLIRIHLREENIGEALSLLEKLSPYQAFGFQADGGLALEIAAAAEATHPRDALRIYQKKIERLIKARGRDNYAIAARLLKRVRSLYRQLEELDAWDHYISAVRNQKPHLPALLDELQKAGI
ncbi:MAG: tetratricopeptide repeat protein, partial [Chloroflexota bacterium]